MWFLLVSDEPLTGSFGWITGNLAEQLRKFSYQKYSRRRHSQGDAGQEKPWFGVENRVRPTSGQGEENERDGDCIAEFPSQIECLPESLSLRVIHGYSVAEKQ